MTETTNRIKVTSTGVTHQVELDGTDVSGLVCAAHIDVAAGEIPTVVLELAGHKAPSTLLDGVARVYVQVDDPGPAAAKFLAAIDPELLEQAALNRIDLDPGPHGLTRAMLTQLTEWADGRS